MVAGFFHGVQTQYKDTVPRPVTVVPSATIALVGTAPTYKIAAGDVHRNDPILCASDIDDARYGGAKTPGFTIPYALDAVRDNGGGRVHIINVWDPATHRVVVTALSNVSYTFPTTGTMAGRIQLEKVTGASPSQTRVANTRAEGIQAGFAVTGAGGTPTYAVGTDYTIDQVTGIITRVPAGTIPAGATVRVAYTYAAPELVAASDIIGAVVSGDRTGLQAVLDIYALSGARPKILIAPGFSELATVAAEMAVVANKVEATTFIDAPIGVTPSEAIAGRAGTSPVTHFQVASRRIGLCYPRVRDTEGLLQPLSSYVAGVIAQTDRDNGYWWSPSNKPILGIIGVERPLSSDFADVNSEVSLLNQAGIITVANNFGTGYLLWGNRSSLYPSDTTPLNFVCVSRTLDIFHESLQRACLPFVDRPINDALIDAVLATGSGFIREQVTLGALINGSSMRYNPANNPPTQLAAGRIVFTVVLMIPTPAETIVFETNLDINLLSTLGNSEA